MIKFVCESFAFIDELEYFREIYSSSDADSIG